MGIKEEVLSNHIASCAYLENKLRREIAIVFKKAIKSQCLTDRQICAKSRITGNQLDLLLHNKVGGKLNLSTLIRVAKVLNLNVRIDI